MMVVRVATVSRGHWRVASRSFGHLNWMQYVSLRARVLDVVMAPPPQPDFGRGHLEICTDGGSGELSFYSHYRDASAARGGCGDDVFHLGREMIRIAGEVLKAP